MITIAVTYLGVFFSYIGVLARRSITNTIGVYDQIVIGFLVLVSIFTLGKYIKIKFGAPYNRRKV